MNEETEFPEIVYKYRDWTDPYHKAVLINNHLFFASPILFNDPFDCRIPENYSLLDSEEKIKTYVQSSINKYYDRLISENRDIENERQRLENELLNNLDQLQARKEALFFNIQDKHTGVISLSTRWDSILMWSHYADNHKGYCVGFWEKQLRESDKVGAGGYVTYDPSESFPEISPLEEDIVKKRFIATHSKAIDWQYEKEYRLTKLFYPSEPSSKDRIFEVADNFFAEVIIGLNAPTQTREEIIEVAKKKKGIKIFEAVKVPFKFQITKHEIFY